MDDINYSTKIKTSKIIVIFSEQLKFLFLKFKPIFGGILEIICSKMIEILACYLLNCVIFVFRKKYETNIESSV